MSKYYPKEFKMRIKNLLLSSLFLTISVYADGMNNQPIGTANSGMMRQENEQMFKKHKSMLIQMHQQRIQIIQNGYNCISSATNREALRSCETTEKQSMEVLKAQFKQERESMKQEHRNMGNHTNQ